MLLEDGAASPFTKCVHCRKRHACASRGLCHRCYANPGVRCLYPPMPVVSRFRKGLAVPDVTSKLNNIHANHHGAPTRHLPGTEEKVQVMVARAEACQHLFHPHDATGVDRGEFDIDPRLLSLSGCAGAAEVRGRRALMNHRRVV